MIEFTGKFQSTCFQSKLAQVGGRKMGGVRAFALVEIRMNTSLALSAEET